MENGGSLERVLADVYEAPWEEQAALKSATTGIKKLDEVTGWFLDGEVTILAARSSMGKTDVMLHFEKMAGLAGRKDYLGS